MKDEKVEKSQVDLFEDQTGMALGVRETVMTRLAVEFDKSIVKKRLILRNGKDAEVDYIPGNHVIARLNECFDGEWSFTVVDRIVDTVQKQVAVLGRITVSADKFREKLQCGALVEPEIMYASNPEALKIATATPLHEATLCSSGEWVTKEQWGGVAMNVYSGGKIVCLGDDLKIATTDALKKCATLLGVALYLYDQDMNVEVMVPVEPVKEEVTDESKKKDKDNGPIGKIQIASVKKLIAEEGLDEAKVLEDLGFLSFEAMTKDVAGSFLIKRHPFWASVSPSLVQ